MKVAIIMSEVINMFARNSTESCSDKQRNEVGNVIMTLLSGHGMLDH